VIHNCLTCFASQEGKLLLELLKKKEHGKSNWSLIADKLNESAASDWTGKQCRERWKNHLRPNLKKGKWSIEEEEMIRTFYQTWGTK
jgi:myb proto-oncogene protein